MSSFQDIFVTVSAVLSFIKSQTTAFEDYSFATVILAVEEFVLTLIAFLLFLFRRDEDGNNPVTGLSRIVFLLAYSQALIIEIRDVKITYETVRRHAKASENKERKSLAQEARERFWGALLVSLLVYLPFPVSAFARSGIERFQGGNLSPEALRFLFPAFVLGTSANGFQFLLSFLPREAEESAAGLADMSIYIIIPVLWGISIANSATGQESGSLAFLFMIVALQQVEVAAEGSRLKGWIGSLIPGWRRENDDSIKAWEAWKSGTGGRPPWSRPPWSRGEADTQDDEQEEDVESNREQYEAQELNEQSDQDSDQHIIEQDDSSLSSAETWA